MSQQQAQRMYAVALSLVPDQEVAADLVFRSRNEVDLRQQAMAWRRAQGLDAPAGDEPLPALTPDDETLALHLFRRGARRRQARSVGVVLLAFLLMAGTVAGFKFTAWAAPKGLAADPIFAQEPLAWTSGTQDLQLQVFKAQAYPGAVVVWWQLIGPGADKAAESVRRGLSLHVSDDIPAAETEVTVHRSNRVLGRSLFPYLNAPKRVDLVLGDVGGKTVNWALELDLDRLPADPAAIAHELNQELEIMGIRLKIQTVRVGKYATTVLIQYLETLYTFSMAEITADGQPLGRQGTWLPTGRPAGESEIVLAPVPEGSRELRISFPLHQTRGQEYRWKLPAPEVFREFRHEGERLYLTLKPDFEVPLDVVAFVLDSKNQQFTGQVWKGTDGNDQVLRAEMPLAYHGSMRVIDENGRQEIRPVNIVADELAELVIVATYPVPDPEVKISLQGAQ